MKTKVTNLIVWLAGSGLLIALDRVSKILTEVYLEGREPVSLLFDAFELLYSENRGAAFGMMQGQQIFFAVIALFVLIAALYVTLKLPGFDAPHYNLLKLCVILLTAGAFGNMTDRLTQGYVVDFIYFKLINFPVFNIADICVTCGALLLIGVLVFYYTDDDLSVLSFKKKQREETP